MDQQALATDHPVDASLTATAPQEGDVPTAETNQAAADVKDNQAIPDDQQQQPAPGQAVSFAQDSGGCDPVDGSIPCGVKHQISRMVQDLIASLATEDQLQALDEAQAALSDVVSTHEVQPSSQMETMDRLLHTKG